MSHWSWWLSGLALASVPLVHWLLLKRAFAVSGRYSALIDRIRHGPEPELELSTEDLIAALRAETARAFGEDSLAEAEPVEGSDDPLPTAPRQDPLTHLLFLGGLALGGLLSVALSSDFSFQLSLQGETFAHTLERIGLSAPLLLAVGGILVGFGTRMAGGCTSGHGLCGVSRLQPGSLVSTAAFFGFAVAASMALEAML